MKLEESIEIMSGVRDGEVAQASETLSWDAYNIARNINDLELFGRGSDNVKDFLKKYINYINYTKIKD